MLFSLHTLVMKNATLHVVELELKSSSIRPLGLLTPHINECYIREYIYFNTIVVGSLWKIKISLAY